MFFFLFVFNASWTGERKGLSFTKDIFFLLIEIKISLLCAIISVLFSAPFGLWEHNCTYSTRKYTKSFYVPKERMFWSLVF